MTMAIVAGVILLVCTLVGLKMGALRMVFTIVCLVISLVLGIAFSPKASAFLGEHIHLDEYVTNNVRPLVEDALGGKVDIPGNTDLQKKALAKLNLPSSWQNRIMKYATEDGLLQNGVNTFTDLATKIVSENCLKTLTFFLLFILALIAFRLLCVVFHIVDLIAKLPILNGANKGTGMLMGAIIGLMLIWMIMTILPAFSQFTWGQQLASTINANVFTSFMYRHNLLVWILSML